MRYVWLIETDSLGRFDPNNPLAYNVVMNEFQRIFRSEVFKQYAAIVTVLAVAAFWLASCSPSSGEKPSVGDGGGTPTLPLPNTETPTATPTSTETPTATITPTPTEIPFSPETWAGTDAGRIEFNKNMTEWGVDPASYTCDEAGFCKDAAGVEFFDAATGNYEFNWLIPALSKSGIVEKTKYKPAPNHLPNQNYPTQQMIMGYAVPLLRDYKLQMRKLGIDIFEGTKGGMNIIMINPDELEWGVATGQLFAPWKYLVFRTNDNKIVGIPIKPIATNEVLDYWLGKK